MRFRLCTLLTQFSIRDNLRLMLVAALVVSWCGDNWRIETTLQAMKTEHQAKQLELDDNLEIVRQKTVAAERRELAKERESASLNVVRIKGATVELNRFGYHVLGADEHNVHMSHLLRIHTCRVSACQ